MNNFRKDTMDRVYTIHLIKKIGTKIALFIFASIIGMSFVSTLDVLKNTLQVATQLNLGAFFNYTISALTHTEGITYAAVTLSVMSMAWILSDIASMRSKRFQHIEFR